jgi:orotate phosphoribosyltransferase
MKNVDDLVESAAELADRGLSKGEIADELNVSRETASWLVERGGAAGVADDEGEDGGGDRSEGSASTGDVHVDWSAIGRDSTRLSYAGAAMADLVSSTGEEIDLTVGIEKAGVPIATAVAQELDTDLGSYIPRKHQWNEGDIEDLGATFSRNFAAVRGRACYLVDDTITSGTTMREAIEAVRADGGEVAACVVLVDKHGVEEIAGVPVHSLLQVLTVGDGPE